MPSKLILPRGIYHDRVITPQGQEIDLGWCSNIIVDTCRFLLAAFMRGDRAMGIQLLEVGKGKENWDEKPPLPPIRTQKRLIDSSPFRIVVRRTSIKYLDALGNPTTGPTNRIQIVLTLKPDVPPIEEGGTAYPLREFGLFGRFGNKNYMIDYVRHPVIHKQAEDTLIRTILLVF